MMNRETFRDQVGWTLLILGILGILIGSGYLAGRRSGEKSALAGFSSRVDTLIIRDTIAQNRPVPVDSFASGLFPVMIHDTIRIPDTIRIVRRDTTTIIRRDTIWLARTTKIYQDSTFRAVVSGVAPSLDEIQIFGRSSVIYRDRVQYVTKKSRWGLGLQAGLGLAVPLRSSAGPPIRVAPYVGIGVSYNLLSW